MTAAASPETEDHAYFQAIEETFIALRGAPLLLSPADWQVAREWRRKEIPLDLVRRVLEGVFQRRAERGEERRIQSLRYCASAVEEAWEEVESLTAASHGREAPPIDIPARLRALAGALPSDLPGRDRIAEVILGAEEGGSAAVEERLAALDRRLMEEVEDSLAEVERAEIAAKVEETLTSLTPRLADDELQDLEARLRRQIVRRRGGLPVLSLFSPEAGV